MGQDKGEDDEIKPLNTGLINTWINVVLLILVAISLAKVSGQNNRIQELVEANQKMTADMELLSARIAAAHAETELMRKTFKQELASYKEEMTELIEATTGKNLIISTALDSIKVKEIPDGVFSYRDTIRMVSNSGGFTSTYESDFGVTVIKTKIGKGEKRLDFVMGLATTVGVPQFFVDYNGDKKVDLDVMRELVDFIPFADVLNRKMNARNSQNLYDNFLLRYDDAEYVSQDEVGEKGGKVAGQLYKVISDRSDTIQKWVQ